MGVLPDYQGRARVEGLGWLFPVLGPFLKPSLEGWWLSMICYWATRLTREETDGCLDILVKKNALYGCTQLYTMGSFGILIRSLDKVRRIQNIDGGATSDFLASEGRQDSVMDLFNYSLLAVLVLRREL